MNMMLGRSFGAASACRRLSGAAQKKSASQIGKVVPLPELPELAGYGGTSSALVRACDLKLRDSVLGLSRSDVTCEEKVENIVLLAGERGTGKSTSMRLAVGAARDAGCVVMYIPRATEWTHGGGLFAAARGEEDSGPGADMTPVRWYDRPTQMAGTLKAMLQAHSAQMEAVKVLDTDARAVAEAAVSTVENAENDFRTMPRKAGHLFSSVVHGLARDVGTRFVVAIDEYDALVAPTALGDHRGRVVHASAVSTVARHFGRDAVSTFAKSMRNGVVILAKAGYHPRIRARRSRVLGSEDYPLSEETRHDVRGDAWLEDMWARQESVQFHRFSIADADKVVRAHGVNAQADRKAVDRLLMLAGGRGDVLGKMSSSL